MKSIKQIRENFDLITEKEEKEDRKLSTLVRAGLYDAKKLPALKKALDKSADKMTGQEKRMLLNLLDSLIAQVTSDEQVYRKVRQNVHTMNEAKEDHLSKFDPRFKSGYPSDRDIPTVLILKRKAIRVYPDNQKVALYYSQALDKYVTVPFNDIQVGLNEAKNDEDDDNKKINKSLRKVYIRKKTKSPGAYKRVSSMLKSGKADAPLSDKISKALNTYDKFRKKHSVAVSLGATWREASKNKAKKKALETKLSARKEKQADKAKRTSKIDNWKSAGKHTDLSKHEPPKPPSVAMQSSLENRARAAAQKPTANESYKLKLQELREARQYGAADAALDAASFIPGPAGSAASLASAGMSLSRGDYAGAALDAASALPGVGYLAKAAKVAKVARASSKISKAGKITDAARLARRTKALDRLKAGKKGKWKKKDIDIDVNTSSNNNSSVSRSSSSNAPETSNMPNYQFKASPEKYRSRGVGNDATQRERERQLNRKSQQAMMKENVLLSIKEIVSNDIKEQTVTINEQEININNTVAKKIMLVYESVNSTNKKKMEKMLNESAASFNKVLTFALRQ